MTTPPFKPTPLLDGLMAWIGHTSACYLIAIFPPP